MTPAADAPRPAAKISPALLLVPIAVLLGFYLASIGPYWNISPDSAAYVSWARSLAAGQGLGSQAYQPPLTSLLFAVALRFFPSGYLALNALNRALLLASLGVACALIARSDSRPRALLLLLLLLASTVVSHESTQLLSEPTYMLFSFAALWFLDDGASPGGARDSRRLVAGSLCLVATPMARTIGTSLLVAVLAWEFLRRRRRGMRGIVIAAIGVGVVAVVLWELLATHQGSPGKFQQFFLVDQWNPATGFLTPAAFVRRVLAGVHQVGQLGSALVNGYVTGRPKIDLLARTLGVLVAVVALIAARRRTLTWLYTTVFLAVVLAHMAIGNYSDRRLLLPVVPFVLNYVADFAVGVTARLRAAWSRGVMQIGMTAYVLVFCAIGVQALADGVHEAHSSPFGSFPLKRPQAYDTERLALRLRELSEPGDRYGALQTAMWDIVAERHGVPVPRPAPDTRQALLGWAADSAIRYVLVDRRSTTGDTLLSVLRSDSSSFHLLDENRGASLYEVIARAQ